MPLGALYGKAVGPGGARGHDSDAHRTSDQYRGGVVGLGPRMGTAGMAHMGFPVYYQWWCGRGERHRLLQLHDTTPQSLIRTPRINWREAVLLTITTGDTAVLH
ncbi:hypothetical protein NGB58_25995 [Escherichia coli]|nr:hypothetical protein [Escherichia coli]